MFTSIFLEIQSLPFKDPGAIGNGFHMEVNCVLRACQGETQGDIGLRFFVGGHQGGGQDSECRQMGLHMGRLGQSREGSRGGTMCMVEKSTHKAKESAAGIGPNWSTVGLLSRLTRSQGPHICRDDSGLMGRLD